MVPASNFERFPSSMPLAVPGLSYQFPTDSPEVNMFCYDRRWVSQFFWDYDQILNLLYLQGVLFDKRMGL
jgi:hypothetical protein